MLYLINGGEGGIRTPDRLAPMPHFECGAFDHSATSPGAMTGRFGPRSGRVLGEDGGPDKARGQEIRAGPREQKGGQNGAFDGSGQWRGPSRGPHGRRAAAAVAAWLARILADLGAGDDATRRSLHAICSR